MLPTEYQHYTQNAKIHLLNSIVHPNATQHSARFTGNNHAQLIPTQMFFIFEVMNIQQLWFISIFYYIYLGKL